MHKCPSCGYTENPQWRNSRFDYNADYMRFDEAQQDHALDRVTRALANKRNQFPFFALRDDVVYYRRGTGGIWLYRVPVQEWKMPRERKDHRKKDMVTLNAYV